MSEPLPLGQIRACVTRHVSDEESVQFEGVYASDSEAREAVTLQLTLVRDHMTRYNEDVRLVHEKKSQELDDTLAAKGEEIKRLEKRVEELAAAVVKGERRLAARPSMACPSCGFAGGSIVQHACVGVSAAGAGSAS